MVTKLPKVRSSRQQKHNTYCLATHFFLFIFWNSVGFFPPTSRKCHYLKWMWVLLAFACFFFLKAPSVLLQKQSENGRKSLHSPPLLLATAQLTLPHLFCFSFTTNNLTINHLHPSPCRAHWTMLLSPRASVQEAADDGTFAFCHSETSGSIPKLLHTHPITLSTALVILPTPLTTDKLRDQSLG